MYATTIVYLYHQFNTLECLKSELLYIISMHRERFSPGLCNIKKTILNE